MKSSIAVMLLVFVVALASAFIYFSPSFLKEIAPGSSVCQNVYAYDFLFRCCVPKSASPTNIDLSNYNRLQKGLPWWCPGDSTLCEVKALDFNPTSWNIYRAPIDATCHETSSGFLIKDYTWTCTGEQRVYTQSFQLQKGEFLYAKYSNSLDRPRLTVEVTRHYEVLYDCGYAGCPTGATIPGTVGCTFIDSTGKSYWGSNGQLVKPVDEARKLYTVPSDSCYLFVNDGSRRLIGDTCEECESDSDCADNYPLSVAYNGKTYGAVGQIGRLQLYGCVATGASTCTSCVDANKNSICDVGEQCTATAKKSRCDIVHSLSTYNGHAIQCTKNDDCGPNGFCSDYKCISEETAKVQLECTTDRDCGYNVECNWLTKSIQGRACVDNHCQFASQKTVECCSDVNCPSGYFCDTDYKCKEKPSVRTQCPTGYECCVDQPEYFDKACPSEKSECCADHTCAEQCSAGNVKVDVCTKEGNKPTKDVACCDGSFNLLGKCTNGTLGVIAILSSVVLFLLMSKKALAKKKKDWVVLAINALVCLGVFAGLYWIALNYMKVLIGIGIATLLGGAALYFAGGVLITIAVTLAALMGAFKKK